jgi:hypothetical protein
MDIKRIDSAIRLVIMQQLQLHGWAVGRDFDRHFTYAMGTKDYDTAVGVKTAQSYLYPADGDQWKLVAEYFSEGQNVLSTTNFYFTVSTPMNQIFEGVAGFVKQVDSKVSQSYAARLYLRFPPAVKRSM